MNTHALSLRVDCAGAPRSKNPVGARGNKVKRPLLYSISMHMYAPHTWYYKIWYQKQKLLCTRQTNRTPKKSAIINLQAAAVHVQEAQKSLAV